MKIKNTFRTLFNIRVERALPPPGPQPTVGSSVVRGSLRIRLKVPIDSEQWEWFSKLGWRTTDMRTDRRHYVCLQDKTLFKLLNADKEKRERLHAHLLLWEQSTNGLRGTMRSGRKASTNAQDRSSRRNFSV
jgi:hypothetical protein